MRTVRIALALAAGAVAVTSATVAFGVERDARQEFGIRSDGIVDVWSEVFDRYGIDDESWNAAQVHLSSLGEDSRYQVVDAQVEAAFDELFASAASTPSARVSQAQWVRCMGGRWKSSPEFYEHLESLAFGQGADRADMRIIEAELARARQCQRTTSDSFNKGLIEQFPQWQSRHQALFDEHAGLIRAAVDELER